MAGSLIKIDEEIVTSAVASVTLGGANWDSSYDVYVVQINNMTPSTNATEPRIRFQASSTDDSSANYDRAVKFLYTASTFLNQSSTNQTYLKIGANIGTATSQSYNGTFYLFNFNNSSEYSFITFEPTQLDNTNGGWGGMGGGVLTVAQATNGITFFQSSGNIASGTFTLYGLKK